MPINPDLLVSAAMLQDLLVDKLGQPLVNGVVTAYSNTNQTMLKNWYYQSGSAPPYDYLPLPNPMTLSAAGTIVDVNGNDVIPFYYPFASDNQTAETYFFTVYDQFGTFQFSRYNFPFGAGGIEPPANGVDDLQNYIINNRFWRNIGSANVGTLTQSMTTAYNSTGTYFFTTLAPSQHDGFSMPDMKYIKNVNGATETITFNKFLPSNSVILEDDITPEYYLNHTCTVAQTGETLKVHQFPISLHVSTLANVPFTATIQAQCLSGANTITLYLYQYVGEGQASPAPYLIGEGTLNLTAAWERYPLASVFPNAVGLTLSSTGNDAFYLQIGMPLSATFNINFAIPSLYLSTTTLPINSFATYDQIDTVINSWRTGDIRTSLNNFFYWGWVPLNGGTMGNPSSNATTRANADTWPLYRLIWNLFSAYSTGSSSSGANPIAQMYTSTGTSVGYGPNVTSPTTALQDWNANKALSLTPSMGRVIMGTVPLEALLSNFTTAYTATSDGSGNILITTSIAVSFYSGMPIYFTNSGGTFPNNLAANTIYYVALFNGTNAFNVATSFSNAITGNVIAWGGSGGSGINTVSSSLAGTFEGEYGHSLLTTEMPAHQHTVPLGSGLISFTGGAINAAGVTNGPTSTSITGGNNSTPLGNVAAHNNTQPGVYYNLFMKL